MNEVFRGESSVERDPYEVLDVWIDGAKPGDPRHNALSDIMVYYESRAILESKDTSGHDQNGIAQMNVRLGVLAETVRLREDDPQTGQEYRVARKQLSNLIDHAFIPHERAKSEMSDSGAFAAVAQQLDNRRNTIIERTPQRRKLAILKR
jgi:hypothetical protein